MPFASCRPGGPGSRIVDLDTGETWDESEADWSTLSPDGRFATMEHLDGRSFEVVDLATDASVAFNGNPFDYSWTPEGDLVRMVDWRVETCSFSTLECTTGDRAIPADGGGMAPDDVRFAGQTYES